MARETRLEDLEPEHIAGFRAFGRPSGPADLAAGRDLQHTSGVVNPALVRRVYDSAPGTIDLVPGPGTLRCIAVSADGMRSDGMTTTALAFTGGTHGFTWRTGDDRAATFCGVLSTNIRVVQILTSAGQAEPLTANSDDAYWIAVEEPVDVVVTLLDGTQRHVPIPRPDWPQNRP